MDHRELDCIAGKMIGTVICDSRNIITGEVSKEFQKCNAMHARNMAMMLARGLSNAANQDGSIYYLKLGSGGTNISATGQITFNATNTTSVNATLYNLEHTEVVKGNYSQTPVDNSTTYSQPATGNECYVVISATIGAGECNNIDGTPRLLDELGLFSNDDKLLSHLIFSPIYKTNDRELIITYIITISLT